MKYVSLLKMAMLNYLRAEDLFKDAESTDIAEVVHRELAEERVRTIIDLSALRRREDWSYLASKVIGAEY